MWTAIKMRPVSLSLNLIAMKPALLAYAIAAALLLAAPLAESASPRKAATPAPTTTPAKPMEIPADVVTIGYLSQIPSNPVIKPFFDPVPTRVGLEGAGLAIADNNTTGRFTKQNFVLKEIEVPAEGDVIAAFKTLAGAGIRHILLDLPAPSIASIAKLPEAQNLLLYNIASDADQLRGEECAANLLHTLPSRAMRADALTQYLSKKNWKKLFLVTGQKEGDKLYAEAIKRGAKHFGIKVVEEKTWQYSFDDRRTPESEIPVFTQGIDYDVLVVADEEGSFGDLLAYRTWQPRPVAGTQGLTPVAWHYTHELWGAIQLQNRFRQQANRLMTETDYAAWLATRSIGEAASRSKSVEFDKIKAYLLGNEFALAGFKGVPLSYRTWDGQMRQPILLATPRSLVSFAPVEGFMHQKNELDTLGVDQPESACKLKR